MARLLILAHAPLATALRAVACHAFPELAGAADQGMKLKLKALNERERKFDRRLEEGAGAGE